MKIKKQLNKQKQHIDNKIKIERSQNISKILDLVTEKSMFDEEIKAKDVKNIIEDKDLFNKIKEMKKKQKEIERRIKKKYEFNLGVNEQENKSNKDDVETNIINEENKEKKEGEEKKNDENEETEEKDGNEDNYIKTKNFNMNVNQYFPIRSGTKSYKEKEIERRVENLKNKLQKEYDKARVKEEDKQKKLKKQLEKEKNEEEKEKIEKDINYQNYQSEILLQSIQETNEEKLKEFEERIKNEI